MFIVFRLLCRCHDYGTAQRERCPETRTVIPKYMAIHCSARSRGCTLAACMTPETWATTLATLAGQTKALSIHSCNATHAVASCCRRRATRPPTSSTRTLYGLPVDPDAKLMYTRLWMLLRIAGFVTWPLLNCCQHLSATRMPTAGSSCSAAGATLCCMMSRRHPGMRKVF
jgi:hypothetical protein